MNQSRPIFAVATMDTKGQELEFLANCLRGQASVTTVDVGTQSPPTVHPDIPRETIAGFHPDGPSAIFQHADRGQAVSQMSIALTPFLQQKHDAQEIAGVIGLGGSGGTALLAPAFQQLPIGLPKLIVSTVASGQTSPYIGCSDLTLFPSVVDVAGLNTVSKKILSNAAHAMLGMVLAPTDNQTEANAIGMTMFGVTTPCVSAVREQLEQQNHEVLVFHATGVGGQAMEALVASGLIRGVIDVSTTEVADEVVGGVFRAGPRRFDAIIDAGIPFVLSLGALDMVNFGAMETVPPEFRNRTLHVHNANVTLMRTTESENRDIARWIAGKLNRSQAGWTLLIPEKGLSALDRGSAPFWHPEANTALFDELEKCVNVDSTRRIERHPLHINDPSFALELVRAYSERQGVYST